MYKRLISVAVMSLMVMSMVFADVSEIFSQADQLYEDEAYTTGFALLEENESLFSSKEEKAGYLWRMARFQLFIADDREREGASKSELLDLYDRGRDFAGDAVALFPSADAYYWKSSNVGKWGETKGILDSLAKAKPMRTDLLKVIDFDPEYADAWYVFGRLYMLLPGWPISFGNGSYAVSFTRRSIDTYTGEDLKISYYQSLAETLWSRDSSDGELRKKFSSMASSYRKEKDLFDKMKYYEGSLGESFRPEYSSMTIGQMSDREEAVAILRWVIDAYDRLPAPTRGETNSIEEVKELLASWD
ncbi:MAG: hypothetical protein K9M84_14250 [Spirochaetia bacterium]|nr:hypothetical protein [Spirochaetia bacterium]MCF7942767.1 hypothetical protein [Spirochaetia bacterium]